MMSTYLPNPTPWRQLPAHPDYEANLATGEIRRRCDHRLIQPSLDTSGARCYWICSLGRVHRLIMAAHLGRELDRAELVRHLDGNSTNNALSNLALGTARDNSRDRYEHNTAGPKLRNAAVHEIRALIAARKPAKWIAARYDISARHVRYIATGARWSALPSPC